MLQCPRCARRLARSTTPAGFVWVCPGCGGRASALPVLRRLVEAATIDALWQSARATDARGCPCPSCGKPTREVDCDGREGEKVALDVCLSCGVLWFDRAEFERLPRLPATVVEPPLSPRAAKALRRLERPLEKPSGPEERWKIIPGLLGMPVEIAGHAIARLPWATWTLLVLLGLAGLVEWLNPAQACELFCFRTSLPLARIALTSVTSFFLHADLVHLVGNAYFLWVFGDNVEGFLGRWRYLLLLLIATVAGAVGHALSPDAHLPAMGASGGISGVVVFYALEFPKIRLGQFFWWLIVFRRKFWLTFSARTGLIVWFAFQTVGLLLDRSGVSYAGHLGGALAGAACWLVIRALRPAVPSAEKLGSAQSRIETTS